MLQWHKCRPGSLTPLPTRREASSLVRYRARTCMACFAECWSPPPLTVRYIVGTHPTCGCGSQAVLGRVLRTRNGRGGGTTTGTQAPAPYPAPEQHPAVQEYLKLLAPLLRLPEPRQRKQKCVPRARNPVRGSWAVGHPPVRLSVCPSVCLSVGRVWAGTREPTWRMTRKREPRRARERGMMRAG